MSRTNHPHRFWVVTYLPVFIGCSRVSLIRRLVRSAPFLSTCLTRGCHKPVVLDDLSASFVFTWPTLFSAELPVERPLDLIFVILALNMAKPYADPPPLFRLSLWHLNSMKKAVPRSHCNGQNEKHAFMTSAWPAENVSCHPGSWKPGNYWMLLLWLLRVPGIMSDFRFIECLLSIDLCSHRVLGSSHTFPSPLLPTPKRIYFRWVWDQPSAQIQSQ